MIDPSPRAHEAIKFKLEFGMFERNQWWRVGFAQILCALFLVGCGECGGAPGSGNNGGDMSAADMDEQSTDQGDITDPDQDTPDEDMSEDMTPDEDMGVDMDEDTTPPVVTITSAAMASASGDYTLTGTVTDDVGVTSASYALQDAAPESLTIADDGTFTVTLSLVDDPTEIEVVALDAAGNEGEAQITVDLEDVTVTADFVVSPSPRINDPVVFDASASTGPDGAALTYRWVFDDGEELAGVKVGRIFHEPADVQVTLHVEADALSDQKSETVTIAPLVPRGTATLSGVVVDTDRGALANVDVIDHQDQVLATTDEHGRFEVTVDRAVPVTLRYVREGWTDQLQRIDVPETEETWQTRVQLVRVGETAFLRDAAQGGEVLVASVARVTFPADAFVDDMGQPVTGDVAVRITPLDTSGDDFGAFPGSSLAMNPQGDFDYLATHGLMEVELMQDDREVHIAPGKKATIEIPLAQEPGTPEVDLWVLDEQSGLWVQEGKGQVIPAGAGFALRADVSHFSWWNADIFTPSHSAGLTAVGMGVGAIPPDVELTVTVESRANGTQPRIGFRETTRVSELPFDLKLPIDNDVELSVASTDGRYKGIANFEATGNETEWEIELIDIRDPMLPHNTKMSYGDTKTHTFAASGEEHFFTFDATEGDFARVRVSATDGVANGSLAVLTSAGFELLSRTYDASPRGEFVYAIPTTGEVTFVVDAGDVPGAIEVSLDEITEPNVEQEERVDVMAVDASSKTFAFWANAGQRIHVRFFGDVPFDAVSLVGSDQTIAATGERFGDESYVFDVPSTGLYLLQQDIFETITTPKNYAFTITDMPPPIYVATSDGTATYASALEVEGKVRRYVSPVTALESILARPTATNTGDPQPHASARVNNNAWNTTSRSQDEQEGSYGLDKIGAGVSGTAVMFHAIYHHGAATGGYTIDIEKMLETMASLVGDCQGATTSYLTLAASAALPGGVVSLCAGEHESFDGVNLGEGFTIAGAGSDQSTIEGWRGATVIATDLTRIEGVSIQMNGAQGMTLGYDRASGAPMSISDVRVLGDAAAANLIAVSLSASGSSATPDQLAIEDLVITGPVSVGLDVEDISGALFERVDVSGASSEGITLNNTNAITLSDAFITDSFIGIAARGRATNTIIEGATIVTSQMTGSTGINLIERAPSNGVAGVSILRNNAITLSTDGDTGIYAEVGENPSKIEFDANFIDGADFDTIGIWLSPRTGGSGSASFTNNILVGHDRYCIDLGNVLRFAAIDLLNNSLRTSLIGASSNNDVIRATANGSNPDFALALYNNIIVGDTTDGGVVFSGAVPYSADYNLFYNLSSNYSAAGVGLPNGANDILGQDPLFTSDTLEVAPASPAVNAGSASNASGSDYSGNMRPVGGGVDIGAHEQ